MDLKSLLVGVISALLILFLVLIFFFKNSYHTYHGDLPGVFKKFLLSLGAIILIFTVVLTVIYFNLDKEVSVWRLY